MAGVAARLAVRFARMSERPIANAVALRDCATGRYLGAGPAWFDDVSDALQLGESEAHDVRARFLCEPGAVEVVVLECRAVA